MQWIPSLKLRSIVLVVFLIGLPILAIPWVSKQLDSGLYGAGQGTVPDLVVHSPPQRTQVAALQEGISPARFDQSLIEPEPERPQDGKRGLDLAVNAPPLLAAPPQFAGQFPSAAPGVEIASNNPVAVNLGPQAYVQQVRQKLEDLGAQYVVLEELEAGQRYRFAAQMQVSPRTPQIQPFEAIAADPVAAARTVLAEVETWRTAALPPSNLPNTTLQR